MSVSCQLLQTLRNIRNVTVLFWRKKSGNGGGEVEDSESKPSGRVSSHTGAPNWTGTHGTVTRITSAVYTVQYRNHAHQAPRVSRFHFWKEMKIHLELPADRSPSEFVIYMTRTWATCTYRTSKHCKRELSQIIRMNVCSKILNSFEFI